MTHPIPTGASAAYVLPGIEPMSMVIIRTCCAVHGMDVEEVITSRTHNPALIDCRHQCAFMVEALTGARPKSVAQMFGLTNHSIMNYIRRRVIDLWDTETPYMQKIYETGVRLGMNCPEVEQMIADRREFVQMNKRGNLRPVVKMGTPPPAQYIQNH